MTVPHMPTWDKLNAVNLSFLPIGSVEQHGPHLPLNTDGIISSHVSSELSKIFSPSYLLPVLPYSSSFEHAGFKGTISLRLKTIEAAVRDIVQSLAAHNISCVIVNFHFGNNLLFNIVQELNYDNFNVLLVPTQRQLSNAYVKAGLTKNASQDMHAGEAETSLLLHLDPNVVKLDHISDVDVPYRPLLNTIGFKGYSNTGVIGFPSLATKEKGSLLFSALCNEISNTVKEFISFGKK